MDIALDLFDEHLGDWIYSSLRPFSLDTLAATLPLASSFATKAPYHAVTTLSNLTTATLPNPSLDLLSKSVDFLSKHTANLPRDSVLRQCLSLYAITYAGILLLYFSIATLSYYFIFDHRMAQHPRYLPNQVAKEIAFSLEAFPMLDLLTLPWFLGDVRGWSMLYDTVEQGPFGEVEGQMGVAARWGYMFASAAVFLLFTDFCIYWVHRFLHIPVMYRKLHKPHHKWVSTYSFPISLPRSLVPRFDESIADYSRSIVPTPFASHAFHPVDGYLQSVPYHLTVYLIPIHKYMFIGLFTFVNLWSIFVRLVCLARRDTAC